MPDNYPNMHRLTNIPVIAFMVIALALTSWPVQAQHYPVRVNTIVTPPYSARLSDYAESGYDRVQLLINPLDMGLMDYKVKVKLVIESLDGRVLIQTDPNYLPPPVYLNGGVTEFLTSYDVQGLFDAGNLIFIKGITKNEYLVSKKLPENYYRIGFVLLDYNRATLGGSSNEVAVSNYGYTMAGLFLNDPPILNLPLNGIKQNLFEPQQVVLQWTPRHKGSPNSAFSCEYVVRLYEVWNEGYSAAAIAQTQMPVFETVTSANRYVYGIADPMLIPGKKYVWTVQARDADGRDMFRNNGLSEAFMFTWGDACTPPADFEAVPVNGPGMELKWVTAAGHTDYDIRYRLAGSNGEWYEQNSLLTNARIGSLRYNTRYEVSVRSNCGTYSSDYTLPVTVKMPEEPKRTFNCGAVGDMAPITSTTPLTVLPAGAIFYAGGFECHVVEAKPSVRGFSGTCYVVVPFYGFAKVLHTFDDIRINLNLQMYSGKLVSVTDTVKGNALMARIDDAMTAPGTGYNNDQVAQILGADTVIVLKDRIKTVEVNDEGKIVVTYNNGKEEVIEVEEGTKVVISDRDGEQYYVDNRTVSKAGDAIAAAASSASQQVADAEKAKELLPLVRFAPADNMQFGFDSLVYPELRSQYLINTVHGKEYTLPYKSVATGAMDVVDARMPAGDFSASGLSFRINQTPVVALPASDDNVRTVNVTPLMSGDEQVLEAVYTLTDTAGKKVEETLGQLNVVAYDKQIVKLYAVPVGASTGYNENEIIQTINKIYSQAVVEWNIEWVHGFNTDTWKIDGSEVFDDTDADERMDYTPAMKALIRAYKDVNNNIDRQAVYVFLFDGEHRNTDLDGYMPFNKQFAFVFTGGMTTEAVAHNIAHEIAHGTFNLRHTFSDKNRYIQSRGTTQNLMDYTSTNANGLNKYQWDLIHNPQTILFSFLQDEEEGAYIYEFLGKKYEALFDKVYSKNYTLNTEYFDKIQGGETNNFAPEFTDDELKEFSEEEKTWIKKWEVRARKSNDVLLDVIDAIQTASAGEKMSKIVAQQNMIYIVKCSFDDYDFNVAIYGQGEETTLNKIFTKVVVGNIDDLSLEDNKKHLYVDVNEGRDYWIMALFEDGKTEPSLIVQISGKYNVLKAEKWLTFLNIINPRLATLDKDPNFDWMEDVNLDDDISEEELAKIVENRNSVNDRTDKSIYGDDAMRSVTYHGKTGYMYKGEDKAEPEISGETEFEKEVKTEIYNEILSEGGFSAINAYDGEIITWGKGFAVNGQLMEVFELIYENDNIDFKQIFNNVGIKIVDDYLCVLDSEGNWKKDSKTAMDASNYIRNNSEILSFLIELAEKDDYSQAIANIQYDVLQEHAGKYPSYILKSDKNSYADNWSHKSVTVLAHLSHFLTAYSWKVGDRYKDTKGNLDKIIYIYIYKTAVNAPSARVTPTLETNIYQWWGGYDILGSLGRVGNPDGAGLEELDSKWSEHTIEIEFKTDADSKLRAVKKGTTEYISNKDCVLIKTEGKYIVLTKDNESITYDNFKEKKDDNK